MIIQDSSHIHALRHLGEEALYPFGFFVGSGVGVLVWYLGVHFFSMAERMDTGSAPERNIIIASRATSMQTAQP
jgi:hypothetical protein